MGTEPGAAKRGYGLEPLLRKHGSSAVRGLISEGVRFPSSDRLGFHEAPSFVSYGFQSGFQSSARHPALAMLLKNSKASDSPESLCGAFGNKPSILAAVVDTRKLLSGTVLAPSDWLSLRVDEYSMRASAVDEFSLSPAVPHASLRPGRQPLVLGQPPRPVKMHTPARVPPVLLREKSLKIRPGLLG